MHLKMHTSKALIHPDILNDDTKNSETCATKLSELQMLSETCVNLQ